MARGKNRNLVPPVHEELEMQCAKCKGTAFRVFVWTVTDPRNNEVIEQAIITHCIVCPPEESELVYPHVGPGIPAHECEFTEHQTLAPAAAGVDPSKLN